MGSEMCCSAGGLTLPGILSRARVNQPKLPQVSASSQAGPAPASRIFPSLLFFYFKLIFLTLMGKEKGGAALECFSMAGI